MDGFTETILLDCNRRNSEEYKADPYASEKSVFTNETGDGLKLDIGDKVSLHSAFVSGRGVGGDVIEIKGQTFTDSSYTLPYTNMEIIKTDISSSMAMIVNKENAVVVDISASHKTFQLKDNEINISIGYYVNTNGENYFYCPRRFDKSEPDSLSQSASHSRCWTQYYQNPYSLGELPLRNTNLVYYNCCDTGAPYNKPANIAENVSSQRAFKNPPAPTGDPPTGPASVINEGAPSIQGNLMVCRADYNLVRYNSSYSAGKSPAGHYNGDPPTGEEGSTISYNSSRITPYSTLELANDNSRFHIMVRGCESTEVNSSGADGIRSVYDAQSASYLNASNNHYIQNAETAQPALYGHPTASNHTLNYRSAPWTAKYIDYREIITLSVEPGYDTPSNIAKNITDEIQKVGQPQTTTTNPHFVSDANRGKPETNGKVNNFPITIKNESPTFKLFRAHTGHTFSHHNYIEFQNASLNQIYPPSSASTSVATSFSLTNASNKNQALFDYYNGFTFIGVKRPDLFKLGRDLHGEYSIPDARKAELGAILVSPALGLPDPSNPANAKSQQRLGGFISWELLKKATLVDYTDAAGESQTGNLLITKQYWDDYSVYDPRDLPLHGSRLKEKIRKFMIAQGKYPELFDYPNYEPTNSSDISASYTRFLHLASRVYGTDEFAAEGRTHAPKTNFSARGTYNRNPGQVGTYKTGNMFNQLGNDYWHETTGLSVDSEDLSKGLFNQFNYFHSNPIWIVWNEKTKNNGMLEGNDRVNGTDLLYGCMTKYQDNTDPSHPVNYIAFLTRSSKVKDPNLSFCKYGPLSGSTTGANGSFSVDKDVKFGWDYSANAYGCPIVCPYTGQIPNAFDSASFNGPTQCELNARREAVETTNFQNQLYIGSLSPLFNFDSTESRFSISDLHTPEYISQPFDAGAKVGEQLVSDASNKAYKINKRLNNFTFCPDMVPYQSDITSSFTGNGITNTIGLARPNINLKNFTIFDAHSGISLVDFGISRDNWLKSLWNTLGFTWEQMNASSRSSQIRNNDIISPNMNLMTTNAVALQSDIVNYSVSYYGATMYQPNLPVTRTNAGGEAELNALTQMITPAITLTAKSARIIADNLPTKSTRPYYLIKSNLLPNLNYKSSQGDLPIVAVVTKINGYQDAFSQDGTQMEFTITKPIVINNIKTMITDPDGSPARVDDSSGVIYKIQKNIKAQMNLVQEYLQQQQMKDALRAQEDAQFAQVLSQGGGYSAFQDLEERLEVANQTPVPSGLFVDPIAQDISQLESNTMGRHIREILSQENLQRQIERNRDTNANQLLDELFNRPAFQSRFESAVRPSQEEIDRSRQEANVERERNIQQALENERGSQLELPYSDFIPTLYTPQQVEDQQDYDFQGLAPPPPEAVGRMRAQQMAREAGAGVPGSSREREIAARMEQRAAEAARRRAADPEGYARARAERRALREAARRPQTPGRALREPAPAPAPAPQPTAMPPREPRPMRRGQNWVAGGYPTGQRRIQEERMAARPTRRTLTPVAPTRPQDRPAFRPPGGSWRTGATPQPPPPRADRGQIPVPTRRQYQAQPQPRAPQPE
jgi:hypothetical protein